MLQVENRNWKSGSELRRGVILLAEAEAGDPQKEENQPRHAPLLPSSIFITTALAGRNSRLPTRLRPTDMHSIGTQPDMQNHPAPGTLAEDPGQAPLARDGCLALRTGGVPTLSRPLSDWPGSSWRAGNDESPFFCGHGIGISRMLDPTTLVQT